MNSTFQFEQLPVSHYPLVKAFYKKANYLNQIGRKDEVYVIRDLDKDNQIIAAVRLVKNADYLILRSMVVMPENQRNGIGHFFLQQLRPFLQNRNCWCYPFEWLEGFYAHIGFKTFTPETAPKLIENKYHQYLNQGRKILIMGYP